MGKGQGCECAIHGHGGFLAPVTMDHALELPANASRSPPWVLHRRTTVIDHREEEEEDTRKTRSELRAGRKAVQAGLDALTMRLAKLSPRILSAIDLDEDVVEAVTTLAKIPHGSGYARQRRLIARTLRDYDVEAIDRRVDIALGKHVFSARPGKLERWRTRLVEEGDSALAELLEEHPGIDRQRVRQAVRAAVTEQKKGATRKRWKVLYEMLSKALP
ncbi:MAG: DUF615 domain-containing protein [Deltaproteobacteria bacterium]|nr:DUF615 domain-containing protein [Deltaproteobacteria bacterium]